MDKNTPLHDWHKQHRGMMVSFAGWQMPLHYGSQLEEHHQVRRHAGIFDVSHMTVVDLQGERVIPFCRFLLANNVDKLTAGRALYSCLLNERGTILDDLICYHLTETHFRLVVNAATTDTDLAWITQQAKAYDITVQARRDLAMFALQGPQAVEIASALLPAHLQMQAQTLKPFHALWEGDQWFVARTGYTGEDGFEWIIPAKDAVEVWQRCIDHGFKPCGLGARDTLRLEAGLNLYGTDMDDTLTPLESNLTWTVAFNPNTRDFMGRAALEKQQQTGVQHQLVGVVLTGKGVMRHGMTVRVAEGEGVLTSGSFAPSLQCSIGMARIPTTNHTDCEVFIRQQWQPAKIVKMPFIKQGSKTFSV